MKLTKYLSANILFLLGILLFILFILMVITGAHYDGQNKLYIDSLIEHWYIYIPTVLGLLVLIPIEMLFHRITNNKFLLNIPFKNDDIRHTYNFLFWFGIICSIFYLSVFIWGVNRI